jgi:hypothetical protein
MCVCGEGAAPTSSSMGGTWRCTLADTRPGTASRTLSQAISRTCGDRRRPGFCWGGLGLMEGHGLGAWERGLSWVVAPRRDGGASPQRTLCGGSAPAAHQPAGRRRMQHAPLRWNQNSARRVQPLAWHARPRRACPRCSAVSCARCASAAAAAAPRSRPAACAASACTSARSSASRCSAAAPDALSAATCGSGPSEAAGAARRQGTARSAASTLLPPRVQLRTGQQGGARPEHGLATRGRVRSGCSREPRRAGAQVEGAAC